MEKIKNLLKNFLLSDEEKALLNVETDVSSKHTESAGSGKIAGAKNKNGTQYINNSTTNYVFNFNEAKTDQEKTEFITELKEAFARGEVQFIAEKSEKDLTGYNDFETAHPRERQLLAFLQTKIPKEDFYLVKTGLYIKELQKTDREKALKLKERASARSRRAKNIINLATAGYFESYIRPILEKEEDNNEALAEYEEIAEHSPEIIFVHNGMTDEKILSEITEKIARKNKYHLEVNKIIVNALGKSAERLDELSPTIEEAFKNYPVSKTTSTISGLKKLKLQFP